MNSFVLFNGDVYSSVDPFATALAVNGSQVVWVGSDEAALARSEETIDLDGDFVTPGFVHAGLDARTGRWGSKRAEQLVSAGITTVHVFGPLDAIAALNEHPSLDVVAYPTDGVAGTARALPVDTVEISNLPQAPVYVIIDSPAGLDTLGELIAQPGFNTHAQRYGWRIYVGTHTASHELTPLLAASGIALTLDPLAHEHELANLLSAGAQVSFGLAAQPWQSLQAAVFRPGGISGRAAFNCATRFGHRAAGNFEGGTLAPASQATLARWQVEELLVQVADQRVAAWSTDPRSGTPGLPNLAPGHELPSPVSVWISGTELSQ